MVLRKVDLSVAPVSSAAITSGAESISTVANGGTVTVQAGIGLRLAVGSSSGDDALVQTPERMGGNEWIRASITALLGGTQAGRQAEIGFLDGTQGAFFRYLDGVLYAVVKNAGAEQLAIIDLGKNALDMTRVHDWQVEIEGRRKVYFTIDNAQVATLAATTAVLFTLFDARAGARLYNPAATSGSALLDLHRFAVDADAYPEAKHSVASAAAATHQVKSEGGFVRRARGVNPTATLRYLMLFDKASAPINGDVPRSRIPMQASKGGVDAEWAPEAPLRFAAGIQAAWSTTPDTLTLPGAEGTYEIDYF